MLEWLGKFYKSHHLLVDVLLVALILRLAYLNVLAAPVFDENFYVTAARSVLAGGVDPNPEHPPLAKLVIAASMALFGDNVMSWRLPAVLFGAAGVAFFYFIVLELSKSKRLAALSAAVLALDPLHILLSRTAMLDIFMSAFLLAGAYFALKRRFAWAGLLFGLGMAAKWPAALGFVAVAAYLHLQKRLRPADVAYMVVIAALTYVLVYTPSIINEGPVEWASFQLHNIGKTSAIPSASVQSSTALQWPFLQRPVWFTWDNPDFAPPADLLWLVNLAGGTPALGVVALGNPVFWIPGLLALVWLAAQKAKKLSPVRMFAVVWFACTYLPFLLISRTHMFIYYMLPVLPAYALALSQFLVTKKLEKWYLIVLVLSLVVLLPLIIGLPAPQGYFELLRPLIGTHPLE